METRAAGARGVRISFYLNEEQRLSGKPEMFGEGVNHIAALEVVFPYEGPQYTDDN